VDAGAWAAAFAITLVLELPCAAWLLRARSRWRGALAAVVGTAITHPLLWFAWSRVFESYWLYIATGEGLVVLLETVAYRLIAGVGWRMALGVSAVVNAVSYLVPVLLRG